MDSGAYQINSRPRALLLSGPTSLGLSLLDNFLANYCRVSIFSREVKTWNDKTFYLKQNKFFEITNKLSTNDFSYFIIDQKTLTILDNWKEVLETIYKIAFSKNAKILLIAPLVLNTANEKLELKFVKDFFASYDLFSLVFVGETFGQRLEMDESIVSKLLYEVALNQKFSNYSKDFYVYPTFSPLLAKKIVKEVFSFSNPKEELLFLSNQVKFSELIFLIKQIFPNIESSLAKDVLIREVVFFKKRYVIETNLKKALQETFDWFKAFPPKSTVRLETKKVLKTSRVETVTPVFDNKKLFGKGILTLFLVVLSVPLILLMLSMAIFFLSVDRVKVGDLKNAELLFNISSGAAELSRKENVILVGIPLIGRFFRPQEQLSGLLVSTAETTKDALDVLGDTSGILSNVLKKNEYDLESTSSSLALRIDTLYKNLSFLEGDFGSIGIFKSWAKKFVSENKLGEVRQKILQSKNIFYELPNLLAAQGKNTYLVLFQNNMELRPTGGFIGSFALVTFDKGNLTNFEVHDVYEADGALKGHVEPPEPIRKYLNEANWYLRDSNWDSDFTAASTKAEWFLGKELNKQVDGVVAIDLNVVSELLKVTGPIYLSDFNKQITSENLYSVVQGEAENNFFPGSQQKRSILTALSRVLIQKLSEAGSKEYLKVGTALYKSLKEKHILVFLHNRPASNSLADMGFDGSVKMPGCSDKNCYSDAFGIVEANLGVNKENYFLKRSMNVNVDLKEDSVQRVLTTNYVNTDSSNKENRSYKSYVRILLPTDASVENLSVNGLANDYDQVETQGRKEIGFWIEVPILGKTTTSISWRNTVNLDFQEPGSYKLYIRKQPGTDKDPISIVIKSQTPLVFDEAKGAAFLTNEGEYVYNMLLAEDLNTFASWK